MPAPALRPVRSVPIPSATIELLEVLRADRAAAHAALGGATVDWERRRGELLAEVNRIDGDISSVVQAAVKRLGAATAGQRVTVDLDAMTLVVGG